MAYDFKCIKKDLQSRARLGKITTHYGQVNTPVFMPVGTQATVKAMTPEELKEIGVEIILSNTYHLYLRPGHELIRDMGGLHRFIHWDRPILTDSGGYQVFSMGFGSDQGIGKNIPFFPGADAISDLAQGKREALVSSEAEEPKNLKITEEGATFSSPRNGDKIELTPEKSVVIQEGIGADIFFAFDECTPPLSSREYVAAALDRTHRWAKTCVEVKRSKQALFGIVQGSRFKEMRLKSTAYINSLDFDGYGIGGDLGRNKRETANILSWVVPNLNQNKPRHLLGIGRLEDMELIIKRGIDLFDCTVPTQYARRGQAFTRSGKINFRQSRYLKDSKAIDPRCGCAVCQTYDRRYVAHLVRASEMTGLQLITFHNLFYFNSVVEDLRKKIQAGKI